MKKFMLSCLVIILTACSQDDIFEVVNEKSGDIVNLSKIEYLSITRDGTDALSEDEIKIIISDFLDAVTETTTTRAGITNYTLDITSKYFYAPDYSMISTKTGKETTQLPIYELTISSEDGDGIIYFSADERNPEIIALVPKSATEEIFIQSGSAFLVEWAKKSSYERLMDIERSRKILCTKTIKKICKGLGIDESSFNMDVIKDKIVVEQGGRTKALPIDIPTTQIVSICEPIVKTEWSQGSPYNLSLPVPDAPSTQAHVYTGCAVTAACQLMTAIKPDLTLDGTIIDWDYLTETSEITTSSAPDKLEMLGKLHSWVFDQLDAQPSYNNNGYHDGTGVSAQSQVWFYGNYFNHSENYSLYNPDALLRSFIAGYPALIRGQGHAWILDGYIISQKDTNAGLSSLMDVDTKADIIQHYDMYWHANLGWGGSADGYYKLDSDTHVDFEAGGYLFTTDGLYVYPGLYRKMTVFNF